MKKMLTGLLVSMILAAFTAVGAAEKNLPPNAHLAIVGDSITQQTKYSVYMEAYLLMCAGRKDILVAQYGWGGERANGFAARAENDLEYFKPTVVTLCYGMNDGAYTFYTEKIGSTYEKNMRDIIEKLKKLGVADIIVGSPGAVDTLYYKRLRSSQDPGEKTPAEIYNDNLKHLRNIDEKLAKEFKLTFADVHTPLIEAMAKAKAKLGDKYDVCGRDGVHPNSNGHLIMAYAFLKALGCEGNIGEVTIDMKGKASASDGHKVLSGKDGKVEIESEKYPFCFDTSTTDSRSNRSILPFFLAFNKELNRFILKVSNLNADKAKVVWGKESKEFTKAQLEQGINLAAEFVKTPFDSNFNKVQGAISQKQRYETQFIKGLVSNFRALNKKDPKTDPELIELTDKLKKKIFEGQKKKEDEVKKLIVPVKYKIEVTPIK
jgi:lysophospholipase L1-like esterase